jgi:hypothetical protein
MSKTKGKKLTIVQREVLELLNDGHIMKIDRMNMPSIGDCDVAPLTQYSLIRHNYITRKDKTKSLESRGNGFIITEKGRNALLNETSRRRRKRRKTPAVLKKEKRCARCEVIKPIKDFVDICGSWNPRGKYCRQCFLEREQELVQKFIREQCDGRDFCLYCGKSITKLCGYNPKRKSKNYIVLDHMDPFRLGGDDTHKNTVYCCAECNARKGGKSFADWLKELKSPYREIAREVYIEKHSGSPEEFKPKSIVIGIDISHLQGNL